VSKLNEKEIIEKDNQEIQIRLSSIKSQIVELNNFYFTPSNSPINTLASETLKNIGLDYVKSSFGINKTTTKKVLKQAQNTQKIQLEEEIINKINSFQKEVISLLSSMSEKSQTNKKNSEKLVRKINRVNQAKKSETKIKRFIEILDSLSFATLVYNSNLKILRRLRDQNKNQRLSKKKHERVKLSQLKTLVNKDESATLDFKQTTYNKNKRWQGKEKSEFAKDIVSFANTRGGKIILGVVDKTSEITGIDLTLFSPETMLQIATEYTIPPLPSLEIYLMELNQKNIGIIDVPESNSKPHAFKTLKGDEEIYIRFGSINRKARVNDIRKMKVN